MNITIIIYTFYTGKVIVKVPFEIVRETEKCFWIDGGYRFLKSDIGEPILRSATTYPYVELVMVDADEKTLREELSKWFTNEAKRIKEDTK